MILAEPPPAKPSTSDELSSATARRILPSSAVAPTTASNSQSFLMPRFRARSAGLQPGIWPNADLKVGATKGRDQN